MGVQPSEMNLNENYPLQLAQQTLETVYDHFLQQKQQQQQSIQQMEQDAEMLYDQSTGGTDLNISASTCTTSMLFTRPFVSSLSTGRVLDENALSLLQAACSTDQNSHQHKRKCFGRGDDGSVKCWSSGRCHCSKKRGYYKCSSIRGCPARKHVERCLADPSMLIITYDEADHNHPRLPSVSMNTSN